MASDEKHPPPYIISGDKVPVYDPHTPFNVTKTVTVTANTGVVSSGLQEPKRFTSYDSALGFDPGMTTCPSCQQQVMTNVAYKPGTYAWLMFLLFLCLGFALCCLCLLPLFLKKFKDAHHTCPRCNRLLHVEKRKCCD